MKEYSGSRWGEKPRFIKHKGSLIPVTQIIREELIWDSISKNTLRCFWVSTPKGGFKLFYDLQKQNWEIEYVSG
ncbi:hypothetical protein JW877_01625 [bacterium]|nr:hypothetical protein [bacterium]